jgi:tetratricopeptide (TPR) repeat protein
MLNNLGWTYLFTGFLDKSKNYYLESFKLTNDSLAYLNGLRLCEFVSGNFTVSIEYSKKMYVLDSTWYSNDWVGESFMMSGDYVQSLKHYKKWLVKDPTKGQNTVFGMHRVGWAYWMNGLKEEGETYLSKQIENCNRLLEMGRVVGTTYRNYYDLAATYAFLGEKKKAYENLRKYALYPIFDRWAVTYISHDPLFDSLRNESEFQQIVIEVEAKYQAEHERVRQWLEENEML